MRPAGRTNKKRPSLVSRSASCFSKKDAGNYLLSQRVAPQVPSALEGLTTVFGMGTGVTLPVSSPARLSCLKIFALRQFHRLKTFNSTIKIVGQASRPISTSKLKASQPVHIWPINHVIYMESLARINREGNLISGGAWHLDAFSAYPFST